MEKETYTVEQNKFHGSEIVYQGYSLGQAIKAARKIDCNKAHACQCGGPTIWRESDDSVLMEWSATAPFQAASEPWWFER